MFEYEFVFPPFFLSYWYVIHACLFGLDLLCGEKTHLLNAV
jgi:hypothetical protein